MFNLSDDDAYSTQLEGKKLKNRGAHMDSQMLEIDEEGPALMEEVEVEEGQEYFTDRELGAETKEDREERLKKELNAARRAQLELQKQQQQSLRVEQGIDDPNLKLDEIEQGVMQSQNKGHKTIESQFKQHEHQKEHEATKQAEVKPDDSLRKTDVAAASALLGPDNIKNLNLSDDIKLADKEKGNSIAAKLLPDLRGGGKEAAMGF